MNNGLHFVAGLPRAGSTLLAALLRQNPHFHAAMSSPVASLVQGLARLMSQENEGAVFIDDDQRARILTAAVAAYYCDIHPHQCVFDTNRLWPTRLSLLARLYPDARIIACVRNPAWVLDSIESLTQRNPLEPSGLFKFDPGGTVYSRADGLMSASGMIGFALAAVREAVFGAHRDRIMLVRYDTLAAEPLATLSAIHSFIGQPMFAYDPDHVEQDYDALMFDARLGAPGLHSVGSRVGLRPRPTILPPDLFERQAALAFWDKGELPDGVRIV
ncbi:MAG: sulfotransferase [Alphaproteobacteria bacterium]|nr:sulfotransferase [Alphaproteobacteria bacterium]